MQRSTGSTLLARGLEWGRGEEEEEEEEEEMTAWRQEGR